MSKYGQFCPVARSLEILGDRWTLLIIRDMITGTTHFNDLERGLPGISRGLLAQRLKQLQHAGIIEKHASAAANATEYHLTQAGQELQGVIGALMIWGEAWAFSEPMPEELDPVLMMWWLRSDVQKDRLPQERVVIQYDFRSPERSGSFWLLLTADDVTLCLTDPGFEIDLLVTADLAIFFKLYWGRISYDQAIHDYGVIVEGTPRLVRAFPRLFGWGAASGLQWARAQRQQMLAQAATMP